MELDTKLQSQVKARSALDGEFAYELGDTMQPLKDGTRHDVKDMARMGKDQELWVKI